MSHVYFSLSIQERSGVTFWIKITTSWHMSMTTMIKRLSSQERCGLKHCRGRTECKKCQNHLLFKGRLPLNPVEFGGPRDWFVDVRVKAHRVAIPQPENKYTLCPTPKASIIWAIASWPETTLFNAWGQGIWYYQKKGIFTILINFWGKFHVWPLH